MNELECKLVELEQRIVRLEVQTEGVHEALTNLETKVSSGFKDTNRKFMKAMWAIIGILLTISGTLIYNFIIK
jgi:hypothetical protein